ncbi:MAG: PAS domain-containing hybrid sensor histidine kinase/response regulator [Syntrophorhabdaceae bacterium]
MNLSDLKNLRESTLYRQIVNTANEGIVVAGPEFKITFSNKQAQVMLGYSADELLGRSLDIFILDEDREDHCSKVQRRIQGVSDQYERCFKRKDGSGLWVHVSASPILDSEGRFVGSISLFTDITQRKLTEQAVVESEERYRTAIECSNDAVAMVHGDKFIYVNKTFVDMFGYDSADEIVGKTQSMTLYPHEAEMVTTTNKRRQSGEAVPDRYECRGIRKNGSTLHLEVSATDTQYRGQTVTLAYLRDITARKHMEEELLNFRKLESIGILAGGIAHDFNNLLMSMLGYISLAKLYLEGPGLKAREKLNQAERTIDRAKELTAQLLTFSKGGNPLKKELQIEPILHEASRTLPRSGISCNYSLDKDLWLVHADETQLKQVVRQLVQNAGEAMGGKGTITISAKNKLLSADQESILPAGKYIELCVSDTGKGIHREHISQVFDPYFTTKDFGPQKGMGLGLAVCYSIVKKHGGQIELESEINKGTTFRILLPAYKTKKEGSPGPPPDRALIPKNDAPNHGLKILIADDEQSILQTTTMLLEHLGHEVVGTLDGSKAIELYRQSKESGMIFDVVILDLVSPTGPDGVQILKEMLRIDSGIYAILSSGYPDDPQIMNHKELGFKGVLLKPYRIEDLNLALKMVPAH